MRLIGQLADEASARTLGDYLLVQGIENQVEEQGTDGWGLWVNDEDQIELAEKILGEFRANPGDAKFRETSKQAAGIREQQTEELAAYQKKVRDRRMLFRPLTAYGFGPLTFVLIVLCVVVAVLSSLGENPQAIMPLFINDFRIEGDMYSFIPKRLPDIMHGQVWRLVTPIFIHSGPLHLIFNMLWLRDLGSMIEGRQSTRRLFFLVMAIAVLSNVAQFFWSGPNFGGMSGVVYGLLGYIWMRGKFDPGSGLILHSYTVGMMIIWFFVCLAGLIPNVANVVHAVGLMVGMAWGYLSSLRYR
jgi:GlpG protein